MWPFSCGWDATKHFISLFNEAKDQKKGLVIIFSPGGMKAAFAHPTIRSGPKPVVTPKPQYYIFYWIILIIILVIFYASLKYLLQ